MSQWVKTDAKWLAGQPDQWEIMFHGIKAEGDKIFDTTFSTFKKANNPNQKLSHQVWGQSGLHREILSQNLKRKNPQFTGLHFKRF